MKPIKPAGLRRGDTIGVVVPAGPIDAARIDLALRRLHDRGFRTKTYGDIYRSHGYLAGDDATRAREVMEAFADPETTAVWCARGGYGVVRMIDQVDFEVVRKHPKVFIGFSDITVLHVAIQQRVELVTFHGPNLQDGFGKPDDMWPATEAALWRAVMAGGDNSNDGGYVLAEHSADGAALEAISPGVATGRLVGGNLAVLAGLVGTPFDFDTRGRVLFLEDIDERLYKIDRYVAQLRLAGKLRAAAAILLGHFTFEDRQPTETDEAVREVIHGYVRDLGIPVLARVPAGHERENFTLPMNALVEVDADRGHVTVRERTLSSPA